MKVHIVTLGCSKNTVDSEMLAGYLKANAMDIAPSAELANAVIINTCGFIEQAKEESINTILEAVELKRRGELQTVVVAGCLSQRYADDLRREIPEVDHFFGTEAYESIIRALSADLKYALLGDRIVSTPQHYAYLKISEGCDHPCSFCAIPIMRGAHRSVPIEGLVKDAQQLVEGGVKEIVLVAQDLTYYGLDLYGQRKLADLLRALSDESGAEWIRCMYAYPSKFPTDILPLIREKSNICNYIDMPMQHASDSVLRSMRRGITRRTTEALLDTIRNEVPGITLRSTFIIGYPNETEADVDELIEFLDKQQLDRVGVFSYSQEDDTYAYILADPIPQGVKEKRIERMLDAQREISRSKASQKIGTVQRVLIEEQINGEWRGRSEADAPEVDGDVYIRGQSANMVAGTFVDVFIDDASEYDLFGVMPGTSATNNP